MQPILRCWTGRCLTCHQPVDLDQLTIYHRREQQSPTSCLAQIRRRRGVETNV
jgi:hypothetical protein